MALYYVNEFGNGTAIFDNLVRAEFHFDPAWNTPTRSLEQEISPEAYRKILKCSARLDAQELWVAYACMWTWGISMLRTLAGNNDLDLPEELIDKIAARLQEHRSTTNNHQSSFANPS